MAGAAKPERPIFDAAVEAGFEAVKVNVVVMRGLNDDELLAQVILPKPDARSAGAYIRFTPRREMDIAVVGAAARLSLDGEGILRMLFGWGEMGVGTAATGDVDVHWPKGRNRLVSGRVDVDLATRAERGTPVSGCSDTIRSFHTPPTSRPVRRSMPIPTPPPLCRATRLMPRAALPAKQWVAMSAMTLLPS